MREQANLYISNLIFTVTEFLPKLLHRREFAYSSSHTMKLKLPTKPKPRNHLSTEKKITT